jgi:hypothetical protein
MAKKDIDYEKFGLTYRVGRRVCHLASDGSVRPLCGLNQLGLGWTRKKPDDKICKNCRKDVTVVKARRRRIAIFRGYSGIEAHVETK